MNEQERKTLEEVAALSRENNAMLHKLLGAQRLATLWKVVYWLVVVGAMIIAYFALQPYLTALIKIYSGQDVNQVMDSLPK